jgi:DNA repair protein RadA/Sms
MLRAFKNRFGPINEIGIFIMEENGLNEVIDPAGIFSNQSKNLPGASIFVSQEGNRAILVEIQALLDETPLPNPIRRSIGVDNNRVQMLCAVIHKYVDMPIYSYNVFVSLIGGMKFSDTGIDVPTFLAMISSFKNKSLLEKTVSFGEIGLTGEIRTVGNAEDRVKEASRMGMQRVLTAINTKNKEWAKKYKIEIIECKHLSDLIQNAFF